MESVDRFGISVYWVKSSSRDDFYWCEYKRMRRGGEQKENLKGLLQI